MAVRLLRSEGAALIEKRGASISGIDGGTGE